MGNTMGKKRKLGSTSSAKWVAPADGQMQQSKKDALSPLGRSYSMPVHHAKPKSDNYHVVALTSSTYGILKGDKPRKDSTNESRNSMSRGRGIGDPAKENVNEKLRKFDVSEMMVPRPWSDVEEKLTKLKPVNEGNVQGARGVLNAVEEEEPETINMWELMEGLDEDARSPLPGHREASPNTPKPGALAKKERSVETSLSFSSIHTVTAADADFLEGAVKSELQTAYETDTLVKGKCYTHHTPNAIAAAGRTISTSGSNLSRRGSDKENAPSSPAVQRDSSISTLTPVKLNSSANVLQSGFGDVKGNNNSNIKSAGIFSSTPNKAAGGGGVVVESPKTPVKAIVENFGKVSSASKFNHNSSLSPSPRGVVSRSSLPPRIALQQARFENSAYNNRTSPTGFPSSSSSEDSEDQQQEIPPESPLFDPELLASFEKAIEDVSEDEWYRVRRSDAGVASTSGSSSDGDSPLRGGALVNGYSSINKSSHQLETSPLARSKSQPNQTEANLRKMSSRVAPVDFRDVVLQKVIKKVDPFEKFEERCPPGGEGRVVIYVTSLRGIRKTFEDCSHMKLVIMGYRVAIDERDVSMHADFRQELKDLLGRPMPVPRLFIKGRYIGGSEEVSLLHEDGTLAKLLETMPQQTSWEQCEGCGGHRFVPCAECSGSCKVINEDDQVVRCTECNENGLVRCPICF